MKRLIDNLIDRSSLGSPHARAARKRAPREVVERAIARSDQMDARQNFPTLPHMLNRTNERNLGSVPSPGGVRVSALLPGRFVVRPVRDIGRGGLGVVDEVEVVASNSAHCVGTRLARKRLGTRWERDPRARARFEREIAMLQTMRHPNIVSLVGVSLPGESRWYAMPLFRHGSLRTWQQAGGRFNSIRELANFVGAIADALLYAHSMGFVHRDLKPENILLSDRGAPVVADWGLGQFIHLQSRVLDLTQGGPMGSHYYCSLEQWTTGRCGETGDIYSLGVVLAELASGRALPISPVGSGIQQDVLAGPGRVVQQFNSLVRRMTALVSSARVQSIAEVASSLRLISSAV